MVNVDYFLPLKVEGGKHKQLQQIILTLCNVFLLCCFFFFWGGLLLIKIDKIQTTLDTVLTASFNNNYDSSLHLIQTSHFLFHYFWNNLGIFLISFTLHKEITRLQYVVNVKVNDGDLSDWTFSLPTSRQAFCIYANTADRWLCISYAL